MLHIMIKKSFAREINKAMGKDNLEALKKEIISILEKKESQEYKKAIEFFEETENHYTHLEKSVSGEWIEKAGYGVGTVRIWKGKKYKKVAPKKWVRVFDKMDRGAKGSMTRLINKVKACNSEEELYQFCMSNHSIFQDENGNDLPIMDKLRAAIDEQSGKLESGKNVVNPIESKADKYKKLQEEFKQEIADGKRNNTKELQEDVNEWKNLLAISNKDPNAYSKEQVEHFKEIIKIGQEELDKRNEKKNKESERVDENTKLSNGKTVKEVREKYGIMPKEESKNVFTKEEIDNRIAEGKKMIDEYFEENWNKDGIYKENARIFDIWAAGNAKVYVSPNLKSISYKGLRGKKKEELLNTKKKIDEELENYASTVMEKYQNKESNSEKFWNGKVESEVGEGDFVAEMKGIGGGLYRNRFKTKAEAEKSTKNHQALGFESHVVEDRKESEQEKHQNRSDAMKGNKNAYKGGSDEELPTKGNKVSDETLDNIKKKSYQEYIESSKNATLENLKNKLDFWKDSVEDIKHKRPVDYIGDDGKPSDALLKMDKARTEGVYQAIQDMIAEKEYFEQEYEYYKNNLSKDSDLKTIKEDLVKEKRNAEKKNDTKRLLWIKAKEKVIEELESEKTESKMSKAELKKGLLDLISILDEEEIIEDAKKVDFEDFDASQPDLFNSTAYKVSVALDDVFGC